MFDFSKHHTHLLVNRVDSIKWLENYPKKKVKTWFIIVVRVQQKDVFLTR
ncbi:hypothetical protein Hanom_Chr08g00727521 [Helianthus anomalus]